MICLQNKQPVVEPLQTKLTDTILVKKTKSIKHLNNYILVYKIGISLFQLLVLKPEKALNLPTYDMWWTYMSSLLLTSRGRYGST